MGRAPEAGNQEVPISLGNTRQGRHDEHDDPSSATAAKRHVDWNSSARPSFAAASYWAVEQSLALLWITLFTRAFLLLQIGRSAGAADLESTLQKLLHCRSGSRFASYIPIAVRRMRVSAAPM